VLARVHGCVRACVRARVRACARACALACVCACVRVYVLPACVRPSTLDSQFYLYRTLTAAFTARSISLSRNNIGLYFSRVSTVRYPMLKSDTLVCVCIYTQGLPVVVCEHVRFKIFFFLFYTPRTVRKEKTTPFPFADADITKTWFILLF